MESTPAFKCTTASAVTVTAPQDRKSQTSAADLGRKTLQYKRLFRHRLTVQQCSNPSRLLHTTANSGANTAVGLSPNSTLAADMQSETAQRTLTVLSTTSSLTASPRMRCGCRKRLRLQCVDVTDNSPNQNGTSLCKNHVQS